MKYLKNGKLVLNVYHVVKDTPIVTADLEALAVIFQSWWELQMAPLFTGNIDLAEIVVTDISVPDGIQLVQTLNPTIPGELATEAWPNNVASVVTATTGFSGRSFRGRNYYAGLPQDGTGDDNISGTLATNLVTASESLADDLDASDYTWVVASYQANLEPREEAVATPITGWGCNTQVDTQRRRLTGGGLS